jgi:hypothetical protein
MLHHPPVTCTPPHIPHTPSIPQVPKTAPSRMSTPTPPMWSNKKIWANTREAQGGRGTGEGGDHNDPPEREMTPNNAAGQGFLPVATTHRQHPTSPRAGGQPQSRRSGTQQSWRRCRSLKSSTHRHCVVRKATDADPHPRPSLAAEPVLPYRARLPIRDLEPPQRESQDKATRTYHRSRGAVREGSLSSRRLGRGKLGVEFLHLAQIPAAPFTDIAGLARRRLWGVTERKERGRGRRQCG